jgi:hypothetical protein
MPRKRPARPADPPRANAKQLVFPYQLHVGDVILEDGTPAEIVERPTGTSGGKLTRAKVRREGEAAAHEVLWEAWRKVTLVRRAA